MIAQATRMWLIVHLKQLWNNFLNLVDQCLLQVLTYECESVADLIEGGLPERVGLNMFRGVGKYPPGVFAAMSTLDGEHEGRAGGILAVLFELGSWGGRVGRILQASSAWKHAGEFKG